MQAPGEDGGGGDKMDASDVSSDGEGDDEKGDKEGGGGDGGGDGDGEDGSDDEEDGPGAGMKLAACSVDFNVGFFSDQASGFEAGPSTIVRLSLFAPDPA